jgi:hypothetical protein
MFRDNPASVDRQFGEGPSLLSRQPNRTEFVDKPQEL